MDADSPRTLGESLLQWVRSFDGVDRFVPWAELSDGHALWRILQDVDEEYFKGGLPEPAATPADDWVRRWQNLKHIERQVAVYYRDMCNGQEPVAAATRPDLQAIAAESSVSDLERLIMLIIRTAMASPQSNQRMAQRLMGLGRERAMVIAAELRAMEEAEAEAEGYGSSVPDSRDESAERSEHDGAGDEWTPRAANGTKTTGDRSGSGMYRDPVLEREEELLQAQATIDKLQASHAAAQRQLQELRQDKERLQEALDAYRADIDSRGRKSGSDDAMRKLQRQADSDRAYIDDLETQLQSSRSAVERFERQVARHKEEVDATQMLRDDLKMLRTENEDLSQKIKANENLKKKIQALQEQERAAALLREELKQANERLQELERLKAVQAGLEKEIIEKRGLIRNQEYQIDELTTTRKHAEYDARVLAQKLQAATERHERDHEALEELRLRLRDDDDGDREGAGKATPGMGLDAQMKASETAPEAASAPKNEEALHLAEKLAMVEQQLEAVDARLKHATQRNAELEEKDRSNTAESQGAQRQVQDLEARTTELTKQLERVSLQPKVSRSLRQLHGDALVTDSGQDALTPDMVTLQRENRLMASAWFDLSTRLQNNGVSLGRRRQEPRSWIGKQRALVGPSSGLVCCPNCCHSFCLPADTLHSRNESRISRSEAALRAVGSVLGFGDRSFQRDTPILSYSSTASRCHEERSIVGPKVQLLLSRQKRKYRPFFQRHAKGPENLLNASRETRAPSALGQNKKPGLHVQFAELSYASGQLQIRLQTFENPHMSKTDLADELELGVLGKRRDRLGDLEHGADYIMGRVPETPVDHVSLNGAVY